MTWLEREWASVLWEEEGGKRGSNTDAPQVFAIKPGPFYHKSQDLSIFFSSLSLFFLNSHSQQEFSKLILLNFK